MKKSNETEVTNIDTQGKEVTRVEKKGLLKWRILEMVVLFVLILLLLKSCKGKSVTQNPNATVPPLSIGIDNSVQDITEDKGSFKDAQDRVNNKTEEGKLNITLNATPTMLNGSSTGNFQIKNGETNLYNISVRIVEKLTVTLSELGTKEELDKQIKANLKLGEDTVLDYNLDNLNVGDTMPVYLVLYESKLIPVGKQITDFALTYTHLSKGTHSCLVQYTAYEQETQAIVGKANAEMLLTVQN